MTIAAMILGAGLGTRLRPLTDWLAKPLVPVGDRACIAHIEGRIRKTLAPSRIVVNVFHRSDDVRAWAGSSGVLVSHEEKLLGTAGGLANAASLLGDGDVLVWNGDVLSDLDAGALARAHTLEATLAVLPRPKGEGNVGIAEDGRVVRLRGSRFGDEARGGDFLGIHVIGAGLRSALVENGCVVGDVYIPALARGARLGVHEVGVSFTDVGSLGHYVAANVAWLGARPSWADPSAHIHAPFDGSIIGARAIVEAPVKRCIVWPDTRVLTPFEDAIVTPFGVVHSR